MKFMSGIAGSKKQWVKGILIFSVVVCLMLTSIFTGEALAFEDVVNDEEPEEIDAASVFGSHGVAELQMLDLGMPWVGGRLELPMGLDMPGRAISPDLISVEGLMKLGDYLGYTSFQARGGLKYELENNFYTQYGIGYISIGGVGGLTGMVKTGFAPSIGPLEIDLGIVGQRTLYGAVTEDFDEPFWLGVNVGFGISF